MSDGSIEATPPPISPPIIPKTPNFIPGSITFFKVLVCLYALLHEVGIIIARLVPRDTNIAKPGSTPTCSKRKYCKGTIKNPPPTPKRPDANPATIPINAKPIKNSKVNKKNNIYIELLSQMNGSALIICNSIERMQFIEKLLRNADIKKKIYTQVGVNIGELDFCDEDMVLIGSATLREGIDISGGGFKAVILDQLPFEFHKDIVLQCKAEKISEGNANSFIDFFLPRAVLYFKQAVGRLIRHEDDSGIWVVLDYRIIDKSYGKYFLDVISNVEIVENIEDALYFIKEDIHG